MDAEVDAGEFGALASYGAPISETIGRTAPYVIKILNGANPADLPIDDPSHFELVINLKTARKLGLTIPDAVIARADRVVE
jgi:putative ABC transport system substrate-binding protein